MESTYDPTNSLRNGDVNPAGVAHGARSGLKDAARKAQAAGAQEVNNLIADVEDLVGRVGNAADPEIARLRAKVEKAIAAARQSLADGADQVQQKTREALDAGNQYVREQPWQAIGIAAVVGLAMGFLVSRR